MTASGAIVAGRAASGFDNGRHEKQRFYKYLQHNKA
jgi:hypothetical protein